MMIFDVVLDAVMFVLPERTIPPVVNVCAPDHVLAPLISGTVDPDVPIA